MVQKKKSKNRQIDTFHLSEVLSLLTPMTLDSSRLFWASLNDASQQLLCLPLSAYVIRRPALATNLVSDCSDAERIWVLTHPSQVGCTLCHS